MGTSWAYNKKMVQTYENKRKNKGEWLVENQRKRMVDLICVYSLNMGIIYMVQQLAF